MKRVVFTEGKQRQFILKVCKGKSFRKFLIDNRDFLKIPYTTFKHYFAERRTLPFELFNKLCKIGNINKAGLDIKIIDKNWGAIKGGKKGIKTLFQKYDKKTLNKWRSKGGIKSLTKIRGTLFKKIFLPKKIDENLSEIIGVYLGDGTLTKYFLRIFGDKRYDLHYFKYLSSLIETTFKIKPKIRLEKNRNLIYLEILSKKFCEFFKNDFELNYGDKIKNRSKIPKVILNDKKLLFSCLRGLVDTDGSVSKDGETLSIRFVSHNKHLLNQMKSLNNKLKIFTFSNSREIGTRSQEKIKEYFEKVGSSNLSHIIRFCESLEGNVITKAETTKYYAKYFNVNLPYRAHSPAG